MRENAMTEVEAMAKEINARNAATKAIRRALPHLEPGYELVVQRDESGMLVVGRRPIAGERAVSAERARLLEALDALVQLNATPITQPRIRREHLEAAEEAIRAGLTTEPSAWKCKTCGPVAVLHESHSQIPYCPRCKGDVVRVRASSPLPRVCSFESPRGHFCDLDSGHDGPHLVGPHRPSGSTR